MYLACKHAASRNQSPRCSCLRPPPTNHGAWRTIRTTDYGLPLLPPTLSTFLFYFYLLSISWCFAPSFEHPSPSRLIRLVASDIPVTHLYSSYLLPYRICSPRRIAQLRPSPTRLHRDSAILHQSLFPLLVRASTSTNPCDHKSSNVGVASVLPTPPITVAIATSPTSVTSSTPKGHDPSPRRVAILITKPHRKSCYSTSDCLRAHNRSILFHVALHQLSHQTHCAVIANGNYGFANPRNPRLAGSQVARLIRKQGRKA